MSQGDREKGHLFGAPQSLTDFLCPLCGSRQYEAVWVRTERGSVSAGIYHCAHCSFAFVDPARYRADDLKVA